MNSPTPPHEDMPAKLSVLWTFGLINMIFADLFSFMYPGALRQIGAGEAVDGISITPGD